MSRLYIVTILIAFYSGSIGVQAQGTPAELLELMSERLLALESVHQEAEMHVIFEAEEETESVVQDSIFIYQRPDQLVVDSDMVTLVSDGQTLLMVFPMFERFISVPVTEVGVGATLASQEEYIGGVTLPDVTALLSENPRDILMEFIEDLSVEWIGEEEFNGRNAWTVRIVIEDDEMRLTDGLRVWIDQETGLVSGLRAEVDLTALKDSPFAESLPSGYVLDYKVDYVSINEALPADMFVFDTEGLVQAADFEELAEYLQAEQMLMDEVSLLGELAPDFELTLLDGSVFQLSEKRGKVVVIDFWATWCPPCVESLPYLQRMYSELADDDLIFVGISLDQARAEGQVRNMVERKGITYLIGIDGESEIAMNYAVTAVPMLLVIDQEGVVRDQKVGFDLEKMKEIEDKIKNLLDK